MQAADRLYGVTMRSAACPAREREVRLTPPPANTQPHLVGSPPRGPPPRWALPAPWLPWRGTEARATLAEPQRPVRLHRLDQLGDPDRLRPRPPPARVNAARRLWIGEQRCPHLHRRRPARMNPPRRAGHHAPIHDRHAHRATRRCTRAPAGRRWGGSPGQPARHVRQGVCRVRVVAIVGTVVLATHRASARPPDRSPPARSRRPPGAGSPPGWFTNSLAPSRPTDRGHQCP